MSTTNIQTFSGDVEVTGGLNVTGTMTSTTGVDKVTLATNASDANRPVVFATGTTGAQNLRTDPGLTYNPANNYLNTTANHAQDADFAGDAGNVYAGSRDSNNTNVQYMLFTDSHADGQKALYTDSSAYYNPSTNLLGVNVGGRANHAQDADYAGAAGNANHAQDADYAGDAGNVYTGSRDSNNTNVQYILFTTSHADGQKTLYTDNGLCYNPSSEAINANLSGRANHAQDADYAGAAGNANHAQDADNANNIQVDRDDTGDTACYLTFTADGTAGKKRLYMDNGLVYDNTNNRIKLNSLQLTDYIYHSGDTNTSFGFSGNDTFRIVTNNSERVKVQSDGKTIFSKNTRAPQIEIPYALWYNKWYGNNSTSGTYLYGLYAPTNTNRDIAFFEQSSFWNGNLVRLNFTGQHRVLCNFDMTHEEHIGLIVSSTGKYANIDGTYRPSINESVPIVQLCDKDEDKKCFGVISGKNDTEEFDASLGTLHVIHEKRHPEDIHIEVNSVGEGSIWVSNKNGNLENGDYITTSSIVGYGQKQSDDMLHNYTVAKITSDCDFNESVKPVKIPRFTSNVVERKVMILHEHVPTEHWRGGEREEDKQYRESPDPIDWSVVVYTETDDTYHYMKDVTKRKLELNENGVIFEDDLTEENKTEYDLRYIKPDGTIITKDEYYMMLSNNEVVYKAAFVGCTYHCG